MTALGPAWPHCARHGCAGHNYFGHDHFGHDYTTALGRACPCSFGRGQAEARACARVRVQHPMLLCECMHMDEHMLAARFFVYKLAHVVVPRAGVGARGGG